MGTVADRLLDTLLLPAPATAEGREAWAQVISEAIIGVDVTHLCPTLPVLATCQISADPIPAFLPVWVQLWGMAAWVVAPGTRGVIERVLQYRQQSWHGQEHRWPPAWPLMADLAAQMGWGMDLVQAPVPRATVPTPYPEEAWTLASLDQWPRLAADLARHRVGLARCHQPALTRRLITRAWEHQRPDVAWSLGWATWLTSRWPMTVPRTAPGGLVPTQPLLDALTGQQQLDQAAHLPLLLDQVLQPALLQGRTDLWHLPGQPLAQAPGLRFWQRAILAGLQRPSATPLPGEGPAWWQATLAHRLPIWQRGWDLCGTTAVERWTVWLDASRYRRALTAWATLALPAACLTPVWGGPCPWSELPEATVRPFIQSTLSAWVALANDRGDPTSPLPRWARLGLWRTARHCPALRPALVPALLGSLALEDAHPARHPHHARGWQQLRRWAQADPGTFRDLTLHTDLDFLDHAATRARWRDLLLSLRPTVNRSIRVRS